MIYVGNDHRVWMICIHRNTNSLTQCFDGKIFYKNQGWFNIKFIHTNFNNVAISICHPFLIKIFRQGIGYRLNMFGAYIMRHTHTSARFLQRRFKLGHRSWYCIPKADHAWHFKTQLFNFRTQRF